MMSLMMAHTVVLYLRIIPDSLVHTVALYHRTISDSLAPKVALFHTLAPTVALFHTLAPKVALFHTLVHKVALYHRIILDSLVHKVVLYLNDVWFYYLNQGSLLSPPKLGGFFLDRKELNKSKSCSHDSGYTI